MVGPTAGYGWRMALESKEFRVGVGLVMLSLKPGVLFLLIIILNFLFS